MAERDNGVKKIFATHAPKLISLVLLYGMIAINNTSWSEAAVDLSPVELTQELTDPASAPHTTQNGQNPATPSITALPLSPIVTSRPSVTDTSLTVPKGSLQLESGFTYLDNSDHTRSYTLPETLVRLGVAPNTEFRLTTPNYLHIRGDCAGRLASNFGDISIGLSHHVRVPGKIDIAFIPVLNLPTGADNVSGNGVEPELRVAASKILTRRLAIGGQLGTRWNPEHKALPALRLTPTLIGYYNFTSAFSGFLEYAASIPTEGKSSHIIQAGALYLLTERQQLDIRLATGLTPNSPDLIVGIGYTFRVDGLF